MSQTIIVDPLTRIEGHLKVEVTVDGGVVTDARVGGTMARGLEKLLVGKDPRDATYVTERICGVCFAAHGWTSCMAVETAQGTRTLPEAARIIRNLIAGAAWLHDHPLHFYHLSALDYLDLSVLAGYTGSDTYIQKIRDKVIAEVSHQPVEGEYAGPLLPAYQADAYCISDLDTVVMAVGHYLEALLMQVKAKKMSAMLAGKQPHQSGIVAGGVTQAPDQATRNTFRTMLAEQTAFITNTYVNDVYTLGTGPLLGLATSSVGVGHQNYLSYGGFPMADGGYLYPEGVILNGVLVPNSTSRAAIEPLLTEDVTKGWYVAGTDGRPSQTVQSFDLNKSGAYSFIKAPRYNGYPMEVGPLARMMVILNRPEHPAYNHAAVQTFVSLVNAGVQPGAVARHAARALETLMLCDAMVVWLDELDALFAPYEQGINPTPPKIHDTAHWDPPYSGQGYGMSEAPRGALGHWIKISKYKTSQYACVVPGTWNASPTDRNGRKGPYEQALIGCPIPDPENPINIGRIIRSFDPCIACAVHVITPSGKVKKFQVEI
ncbi:MAG: nickel-dependent hydrogenase large subunit [bacterium]